MIHLARFIVGLLFMLSIYFIVKEDMKPHEMLLSSIITIFLMYVIGMGLESIVKLFA